MNTKDLIKNIKRDKSLPKYIRTDLIKILKSNLYTDTLTIVSTLDSSPRSRACVMRFNQLDPNKIRTKQQLLDFKNELTNVKNESLKCTINPYFYIKTKTNSHVKTIGDIIIPNSNNPISINTIVANSKYNYLDKPRMIKDYLITWNRDARKYLENKVELHHEYLAKSHHTRYSSFFMKLGSLLSFLLLIFAVLLVIAGFKTYPDMILYSVIAVGCSALVLFVNAVVNSFHTRRLKRYDRQMKELDRLYERYADHTFDIEAATMKRVYTRKLCNFPLSKINIIGPTVQKFDIEKYVFSQKAIANKKFGFLKLLSFLGFVATVVCVVLMCNIIGIF